jgi:glycosyltransferase involved in cell wall biosynthesis
MAKTKNSILFCALDIYALVGGIQRFNRRVVDSLIECTRCDQAFTAVHILHDQPEQIPVKTENITLKAFKGRRLAFIRESLAIAISQSDILILGHINLLPIGFLAKNLKSNLKLLLFAHGDEMWDSREFRRKRFYEPWMLGKCMDHVAAVSRYTANLVCSRFDFPEYRVSILPNAVDSMTARGHIDRTGSPVLLVVTRLSAGDRQKNVDKVIYAMAVLKTSCPTLTLEIVGDGVLRGELEALAAKLNVLERVRFLGKVSDAELNAAYQRASIFVLPSTKEGFGIVYLEAWQQGLAVIAARGGATSEVVENGVDGLLVDPDSPTALVDVIERLVHDRPLRQRLALEGMRKIEKQYLHSHFIANFNGIVLGLSSPSIRPKTN